MPNILKLSLLIIMMLQFIACSTSPKSEADMYHDMRKGTVYKAYQKISVAAMKPVVKKYDQKLVEENKPPSGTVHVHALLSLVWVASLQSKFALAEAESAVEHASDPRDRYAALTLQALGLHEEGWHFLAKQKSVEANALRNSNGFRNSYKNVLVLVHLAGSTLALKEGNINYAISEMHDLGSVMQKDWLIGMAAASQEAYTGGNAKTIEKLEKLRSGPALSDKDRAGIAKVLEVAKKGGKDVGTNVVKAAVMVAVLNALQNNSLTREAIDKLPEKYRNKLDGYFQNAI